MDGYQFTADLFKSLVSLAWPAALVISVWLFRDKLKELLPLLRFKYKDFDISFRLDQAEKEARELVAPTEATSPTQEEADKFLKLTKISPSSAISERSRDIERALIGFAEAQGMKTNMGRGWLALTRELRKHELIDSTTASLLDDLRAIRNAAVHGSSSHNLTEDDAYRFGSLANKLIASFEISTAAALNHAEQNNLNIPNL